MDVTIRIATTADAELLMRASEEKTMTAALLLQEYPPSISWKGARRGYVASVYTVPERRGEGWATRLLERLIAEARRLDLGCLWLLASGEGKSVYKRLGFEDERPFGDVYMEWYEK